jgi:hypothetical protein
VVDKDDEILGQILEISSFHVIIHHSSVVGRRCDLPQ